MLLPLVPRVGTQACLATTAVTRSSIITADVSALGATMLHADLSILEVGGKVLSAAASTVLLSVAVVAGSWLWQQQYVLSLRARRQAFSSAEAKARSIEVGSPAYVRPQEAWTEAELAPYDGSASSDGPILLAVDGVVYNVAKARGFYGPEGEYAVMGGKDASRYLARNSVEEEPPAQASEPLNMAERAALAGWAWSFKQKYDTVGPLVSEAEAASRRATARERAAYLDRLEDLSHTAARDQLEELYKK
jgi:predicted heme/steroid binding protein